MYEAIVIGASAGGMHAIRDLLTKLPEDFQFPILIVQHISPTSDNYLVEFLDKTCKLSVKEADEKEQLKKGFVYLSPPNYHLLVEEDFTISLSADEKVNYSRPSIDVLFYSASDTYKDRLIGIILTGANDDGARGLKEISNNGGLCIVQDPLDAETPAMPQAAIKMANPKHIENIVEISKILCNLSALEH
jgi:two-component system chemotaxis response regulator CheB